MNKNIIATLLTVLFMALIVAPTVIASIDDSIDTSIFYSLIEEEENGKAKKLISPFSLEINGTTDLFDLNNNQIFGYWFKKYPKPHLNLISPPPEQIIL